uniref:Uncharacterized protein n=1 Tax=Alexandrium monilatum TaxID=311494 RepID=A0A7S4Q316_9DINO
MAREDRLSRRLGCRWATRTPDVFVDAVEARARVVALLERLERIERTTRGADSWPATAPPARPCRASPPASAARQSGGPLRQPRGPRRRNLTMDEILGRGRANGRRTA